MLKDNLGDKYMLHCNKTSQKRFRSQIYKELPKRQKEKGKQPSIKMGQEHEQEIYKRRNTND